MNISDFISSYRNHPVLFVGTGLSLRYLKNSYSWDSLLQKIANDFKGSDEYYFDIKSENMDSYTCRYDYEKIATRIEKDFNLYVREHRKGRFEDINAKFYEEMQHGKNISRFKLHIANLLNDNSFKEEMSEEIAELKKARKNISSVITTNYDRMIEELFSFNPLVGNDILLSNPYGSVYKIHGCISQPEKIIITENDYHQFNEKYELIRAQLLSLFIHNPIIFIGYNIGDKNIKDLLRTIFSYVNYDSEAAKKIRDNFLLVEYEAGSDNSEVLEHDIDIHGFPTIRINKLKTDNFTNVYRSIAKLLLPVSAMDIRKVQNVVREICAGGEIKVSITEDLDDLKNSDKVLVVGSQKTITYVFQTTSEMIANYFQIIEESNAQLLTLINKQKIKKNEHFPIFAFSEICPDIIEVEKLKQYQIEKINVAVNNASTKCKGNHITPQDVIDDKTVSKSKKTSEMICSIMNGTMNLDSVENYLKAFGNKRATEYRKLLCAYDLKKYSK